MIGFGILGAVVLVTALLVVASRNPVISALWLALNLAAVAGIFVLLGAEFLAAIQLIIYAGAVLVFFLFVVMLLNLGRLPLGDPRRFQRFAGFYLALVIAVVLGFTVQAADVLGARSADFERTASVGNTAAVASVLFTRYVFAFEVTSVLLTAAVVGAVVLGRRGD